MEVRQKFWDLRKQIHKVFLWGLDDVLKKAAVDKTIYEFEVSEGCSDNFSIVLQAEQ